MKRPAFQFYPADWRKDMALQSCSVAARGLWVDMLCIAHECEPYGHLTVNGKPMSAAQIGRHTGLTERECAKLIAELEDAGVLSRTEQGAIFSRRMVRDEDIRQRRAEGGKAGSEHGIKGAEHGSKGGRPPNGRGVSEPPSEPPPSSSSSSSPSGIQETPEPYHHPAGGSAQAASDVVGQASPTPAGAVCRALRAAGIAGVNPGHPRLLALLAAGATEAEFVGFAPAAAAKRAGFAWVLGAVEGERSRAAETAKAVHHGAMPAAPAKSTFIADREAQAARWIGSAKLPGTGGDVIEAEEAHHGAASAIR